MGAVTYIVDSKGKRKAVILPIRVYKQLLEDLHDLAVIVESKDPAATNIQQLKDRLKNGNGRARRRVAR